MTTIQNISPFGAGPVTVPGIVDTGTLTVAGTTSLDNGIITTNGTGTITANAIGLEGNATQIRIQPGGPGNPAYSIQGIAPVASQIVQINDSGVSTTSLVYTSGAAQTISSPVTFNNISLGLSNPITIQSAVVTLTPAQVLAMTTTPSTWLQVIGPTPGMFCSVIRCSITGSTTPFTGTPTAQFFWYFWNGSNTQEAYSVAITSNVFATGAIEVPVISTGNQGYTPSWIYGSTFGIGFTSGSNWTGGGSNLTVTVLYYMST